MATTAIDKQTNDEAFITELSDSILREDQSTVDNIGKILSKPAPNKINTNKMSVPKQSKHGRSVTRFCDEANIGMDDELDMAEFILAARYLGNELSEDKLMDVFLDLENADATKNKSTKQVIKDLLKTAEGKYGTGGNNDNNNDNNNSGTNNDDNKNNNETTSHEIMSYNTKASLNEYDDDDANWQEIQIDGFLTNAKQEQNLQIAKNLLQTTALSANEIAEITGVDPELLRQYEEEFETDDDYDDDDDIDGDGNNVANDDENKTNNSSANQDSNNNNDNSNNTDNAIVIKSSEFGKSLVLTKQDIGALDELLSGGIDSITQKPKLCLQLLQKMKKGIDLTPGADKRSKHLKKLKTMVQLDIKNVADKLAKKNQKKAIDKQKKNKLPAKYRIVIVPGALVKTSKELTSEEVAKLPIGTVVTVSEIDGRRCKIIEPVKGWCSLSSKDGRVICQKENTKSAEMESAIHAERARQTKILILKSITTLNDATVQRILERSDWNLRRGIEAFYLAKYKTQEYIKQQDGPNKKKKKNKKTNDNNLSVNSNKSNKKKGWWKSWKKFANQ